MCWALGWADSACELSLPGGGHDPHFTDEETEAQRGPMPCSGSPSLSGRARSPENKFRARCASGIRAGYPEGGLGAETRRKAEGMGQSES